MDTDYDHILIVGFGGPEKSEDVLPFLKVVTTGRNISEARLKAVAHHYEAIGGASPYNKLTFQLVEKMKADLKQAEIDLPVFVGMRNWNPFLKDTLQTIQSKGLKRGVGVILSAFRSVFGFLFGPTMKTELCSTSVMYTLPAISVLRPSLSGLLLNRSTRLPSCSGGNSVFVRSSSRIR